jgi:hypothetical protein
MLSSKAVGSTVGGREANTFSHARGRRRSSAGIGDVKHGEVAEGDGDGCVVDGGVAREVAEATFGGEDVRVVVVVAVVALPFDNIGGGSGVVEMGRGDVELVGGGFLIPGVIMGSGEVVDEAGKVGFVGGEEEEEERGSGGGGEAEKEGRGGGEGERGGEGGGGEES